MYGPYRHLDLTVEDGVATLTLDRPERHNALNTALLHDIDRAFTEFDEDRSVAAVVIEGAGDEAFSAGADLSEYAGPTAEHDPSQKARQERLSRIFRAPRTCHAPVLAKIDGFCIGGGLVLALYCDLRITSKRSTFGLPTAAVGLLPTGGATRRLAEAVGEDVAKELVFTAEHIDAARAEAVGLVTDVVEPAALDDRIEELVASMSEVGPEALQRSKQAINAAASAPDPKTAREREASLWWEQFRSDERQERVKKFLEP